MHSGVENSAQSILEVLRNKDDKIIYSDNNAIEFFDFISQQYFRTKKMRDGIVEDLQSILPAENLQRIRNVICHCLAINVGGSLYVERRGWEIIFLDCPAGSEFITGDQPLINILGTKNGTPPTKLAFYYPLYPSLAMILAPKSLELRAVLTELDIGSTNERNDLMASESEQFIVAKSRDQLTKYKTSVHMQPPVGPSFLSGIQ